MDRKTLLAVVISVVIIVGGMLLQSVLFPPKPARHRSRVTAARPSATARRTGQRRVPANRAAGDAAGAGRAARPPAADATTHGRRRARSCPLPDSAPAASAARDDHRGTRPDSLTFSQVGGTLSPVKLKKYKNVDGSLVDMILLPKDCRRDDLPFALSFGDYKADQVTVPFTLHETTDAKTIHLRLLTDLPVPHRGSLHPAQDLRCSTRTSTFSSCEVTIENSVNEFPALDFGGYAYTLTLGPQIGPHYTKLDGRNDFRNYAYYADGKRQDPKVGMGQLKELDKNVTWAAIVGKYFTAIAVPDATLPASCSIPASSSRGSTAPPSPSSGPC